MPNYDSAFNEEAKIWMKQKRSNNVETMYRAWREEYRRKGVVEFAEKELRVDPKNGGPLTLSEEQKKFLVDLTTGKTSLAIVSAGRGTGKSFSLSIFISYMLFVTEYSGIGVLAGNSKQSGILDEYIKGWIKMNPKLDSFLTKNVKDKIVTSANSQVTFCALSDTAVRGIHGSILIIDEEVAAEEAGGEDIVKTAEWTVNTAKNMIIIRSSTPQASGGYFIETWNDAAKLGYTRYQWSSVKHISGNKDPYQIYNDIDPKHWKSNLPWIKQENVEKMRLQRSNDEWLAEALGVMSLSSGLVFNPSDLNNAICKECKECTPYQRHCILLQYYLLKEGFQKEEIIPPDGICETSDEETIAKNEETIRKSLQLLSERSLGIDWGDKAPDCYNVLARFNNQVFILASAELRGQGTEEKIGTALRLRRDWNIEYVVPDPEQWAYSEALANADFTVEKIWSGGGGADKPKFIMWLKKDFERGRIHIPQAYAWLIKSLRELTYGDNGKIVKRNDHSFDSLLYGRTHYGAVDEDEIAGTKQAMMEGAKLWNKEDHIPIIPISAPKKFSLSDGEQKSKETSIDDFNPFDIEYLKRKRNNSSDEYFENGVNFW